MTASSTPESRIETKEEALLTAAFAHRRQNVDREHLIRRGFSAWGSNEELYQDIDRLAEWAFDETIRNSEFQSPPIESPAALTILTTLASGALKEHEYLRDAPVEKVQLIQWIRELHSSILLSQLQGMSPETLVEIGSELYEKEPDADRPHPAGGCTGIVEHPDANPHFDTYFEIPVVAASLKCEARMESGGWGGNWESDIGQVSGDTHYHIRDNNVYVPIDHGVSLLWDQQKESFKTLYEAMQSRVDEAEFRSILNSTTALHSEVDELLDHGQKEQIWTDWDPQQQLVDLVRSSVREADSLESDQFVTAKALFQAVKNYSPNGPGKKAAKDKVKSPKSLSHKLLEIADSDDYTIEVETHSDTNVPNKYRVGRTKTGVKQIEFEELEDIFELPCFQNMESALKVENGGPIRKDLFNFVCMVTWLEDYRDADGNIEKDNVVNDISAFFESKWDWYDPAETDYQTRYEIEQGEIDGEDPLPMNCDNESMQRHCIGKENCPYSIYGSLPFPQEMYDLLSD